MNYEPISPETAKALLERMLKIRLTEETIAERYHEGKMRCPTHLSTGQEAVPAAAGLALRKDDIALSTHRCHGHYIGKGGSLRTMLAEIYGKETGCSRGKGGSMHLVDESVGFWGSTAIVGGTIPLSVGLAYSFKLKNTSQISVAFLGDGAVEEGVFYESVNFAALKQLPLLFICENNLYSVYSPLSVRQPLGRKIHEMVAALGIKTASGDGNDARASYGIIQNAAKEIRSGGGPHFIELSTYRWREHCGPNFDNDIGYRTVAEYEQWRKMEPVARLETELLQSGILSSSEVQKMKTKLTAEIEDAFRFAEESPFPAASTAYEDLYRIEGGSHG